MVTSQSRQSAQTRELVNLVPRVSLETLGTRLRISERSELLATITHPTIDVTAKVVNKENNKQPIVSKGKQLMKTECVIADHTNTIALTLWEDLIDAVDCGKTYKFNNVKIRSFNDIKYLTTNVGTTIHQDQDIHDINMDCEYIRLSLNISEGKCISAKLKRELSCN